MSGENGEGNDRLASMAASAMGGTSNAQNAGAEGGQGTENKDKKTEQEAAAGSVAASDEGKKSDENPVMFKVPMPDGSERTMTPQQVAGMASRYAEQSAVFGDLEPFLEVVQSVRKGKPDAKPEEIVNFFKAAVTASNKPLNQGQAGEQQKPEGGEGGPSNKDINSELKNWAEKNQLDGLPPGLEAMISSTAGTQGQIRELTGLVRQLLNSQKAGEQVMGEQQQQMGEERRQVAQEKIATNLNNLQAELQLADEQADDFFMFAAERGFVYEDFASPQLLRRVMTDFKNAASSGELDRLRSVHEKRQAFTGTLATSPGAGGEGSSSQGSEGDPTLARMAQSKLDGKLT